MSTRAAAQLRAIQIQWVLGGRQFLLPPRLHARRCTGLAGILATMMRAISIATLKRILVRVAHAWRVYCLRTHPPPAAALASLVAYDDVPNDACKQPAGELPSMKIEPPPLKRPRQNDDDNMFL